MSIELQWISDKPSMIVAHHGPIHRIRKMFETRDIGVFHSEIAPGGRLPREVHKFIEIIYRIKGETVTVIDGKDYVSRPGSYLVVPAGCWHQTESLDQTHPIQQIIVATYNQIPGSLFPLVEAMLCRRDVTATGEGGSAVDALQAGTASAA
jgi:quercetin dioxygenase-like cupin family protein